MEKKNHLSALSFFQSLTGKGDMFYFINPKGEKFVRIFIEILKVFNKNYVEVGLIRMHFDESSRKSRGSYASSAHLAAL